MRNSFIYLLVIVALAAIFFTLLPDSLGRSQEMPISSVISMAFRNEIDTIEVKGENLNVLTTRGEVFTSRKEEGASIVDTLEGAGVDLAVSRINIQVQGSSGLGTLLGFIFNFLPIIFFGAVLLFMMRQAQGNTSQTFSFGRSRGAHAHGQHPKREFLRRRRCGRGQDGTTGSGGVSEVPGALSGSRCPHTQRCSSDRAAWNWQDAVGQGSGW